MMRESFSGDYELSIRQKPAVAKVFIGKEKDRKPIDPPPIVQLRINESTDPAQNYLQSPYYFVSCSLLDDSENRPEAEKDEIKNALAGTLVSSLHRLKDTDNSDGGFFVFGDLSVKVEGTFRLQFTLYEVRDKEVAYIKSISSSPFNVYASKNWPGMSESTFLTRSFSDQGVRLRLRKEPRFRLGPRGPASDNYEPRRYKTQKSDRMHSAQLPESVYQQGPETSGGQRHGQLDYPGSMQQQHPLATQSPISPVNPRKRNYSQSSHSGSYASHGEDMSAKRTRTDPEHNPSQSYASQQYSLSPQYAGRPYTDPLQTQNFAAPYQQPNQFYGGNYSSSPQTMIPREQGAYFVPRRADAQFQSLPSQYDAPIGRMSTHSMQTSPTPAYGYAQSSQQPLQSAYNVQQHQTSQNQYAPQIPQPMPPIRPPTETSNYTVNLESDQATMPSRSNTMMSNDMLPPVYGRSATGGLSIPPSPTHLPSSSSADDPRYPRNFMYDLKSREDNPGR